MIPASPSVAGRDVHEEARRAVEQRRAILGPCLAAMGFSEHGAPPPELPESLSFDGQEVHLDSWERNVLLGRSGGNSATLLAHLAEGVAFRALSASRFRALETGVPVPNELERTRAAMIEETAVGTALQQEVQRDIDRLVSKGEMADAKRLTGFRRKIDQALGEFEQRIGAQAKEQAQVRAVDLLTPREAGRAERKRVPPVEKGLTLEDLTALEEKIDREIAERPAEPTPEELFEASLREQETGPAAAASWDAETTPRVDPARRFRLLMALLAVCVVAYAVFFATTREEAPPPRLGMEYFRHIEAVLDVKPRPPSLFVRLHATKWAGLPAEEKTGLIEELGRIAGEQGYSGVQVKTSDGKNVGQWLRKTGTRLVDVHESAS